MTATDPVGRIAARFLKTLAVARGDNIAAAEFVERQGWADAYILKAAVGASTTGNASAFLQSVGNDFMDFVRARSIVGRIEGFRRMPWSTRAIIQTAGPSAAWVAEGQAVPVGRAVFSRGDPLERRKVAGIAVQTLELAREANTEQLMLSDLAKACSEALDLAFIDPTNAGDLVTPRSATYGQQEVTGGTLYVARLSAMVEALADGGGDVGSAVWIMHPALHSRLVMAKLADPDGRLAGRPVVASSAVPGDSSGSLLALIDPSGVELAGATDAELAVSAHGDIVMDDLSDTHVPERTSLWQTESIAMRATTHANWRAAPGRVVYATAVEVAA